MVLPASRVFHAPIVAGCGTRSFTYYFLTHHYTPPCSRNLSGNKHTMPQKEINWHLFFKGTKPAQPQAAQWVPDSGGGGGGVKKKRERGDSAPRSDTYPFLLYGKLRERAVCGEFCVLIGYPIGQDGAILPARDCPFRSRK